MWPQALQMTRDECRGVLRRLELESYAHVISVFRAQGGLTEHKAKVLEDLRGVFHISQERHRAEARRVANDEQLSTIAETISGPNTWQEWSREGRRSYPLLPRVAPQTALALIANSIAADAAAENAKLPYPAETGAAYMEDQRKCYTQTACKAVERAGSGVGYIVKSDPFKMPDIPTVVAGKKSLKRNMPEHSQNNFISKKRYTHDTAPPPLARQQAHQGQTVPKQHQHITANELASSPPSHGTKPQYNHQQTSPQQQPNKSTPKVRAASKRGTVAIPHVSAGNPSAKKSVTPAKCGRRALKLEEQRKQQLDVTDEPSTVTIPGDASVVTGGKPQIAASKKDITKNLSKLQQQTVASRTTAYHAAPAAISPVALGDSLPLVLVNKTDKQSLISTPVQKYIVEDRQQWSSAPQLLQLPTSTAKLRAMLPVAAKMSPKKLFEQLMGGPFSFTPQMYNIFGGSTVTNSTLGGTGPTLLQLPSSGETHSGTQGKVLTTKLLPKVLSSGGSNAVNITKIETLNNGAGFLSSGISGAASSTRPKSLMPAMIISGPASGSSTATRKVLPAGSVIRKTQSNIIKTGIIGGTLIGSGSSGTKFSGSHFKANTPKADGPQIISNIKLTPAITTVATTGSAASSQNFLSHTLKSVLPANTLRTSVKICQSPNGKVFIQPANLDAANRSKLAAGLQHNLLTTGNSAAPTTTATGGGQQRIAIQKVQIIPAPVGTHHQPSKTAISGQKTSNVVFMPSGSMRPSLAKGTLVSAAPRQQLTLPIGTVGDVAKQSPNVLVIGTSPLPTSTSPLGDPFVVATSAAGAAAACSASDGTTGGRTTSIRAPLESNQMITEDTPVDILSAPLMVDDAGNDVGANSGKTLTILTGAGFTNATQTQPQQQSASLISRAAPVTTALLLGATDWEMELDQATAACKTTRLPQADAVVGLRLRKSQKPPASGGLASATPTIVLDSCYDDVIVEEAEEQNCASAQTSNAEKPVNTTVDAKLDVIDMDVEEDGYNLNSAPPSTDDKQLKVEAVECENGDAGFDETLEFTEIGAERPPYKHHMEKPTKEHLLFVNASGKPTQPASTGKLFKTDKSVPTYQPTTCGGVEVTRDANEGVTDNNNATANLQLLSDAEAIVYT